jgi:hypothetical protein
VLLVVDAEQRRDHYRQDAVAAVARRPRVVAPTMEEMAVRERAC